MKILITNFDAFGGEKINPTTKVNALLPNNISGAEIFKLEIPTVFGDSALKTIKKIKEINPDVVINLGQAGNRTRISIERIAINIDDARIPDNKGNQPIDLPVVENGPDAYFTSLPYKAIIKTLNQNAFPCEISESAGTFVCNHIMYQVLHYIKENNLNCKAGFIHIPFTNEQVVDKPKAAFVPVEHIAKGITKVIEVIVEHK